MKVSPRPLESKEGVACVNDVGFMYVYPLIYSSTMEPSRLSNGKKYMMTDSPNMSD